MYRCPSLNIPVFCTYSIYTYFLTIRIPITINRPPQLCKSSDQDFSFSFLLHNFSFVKDDIYNRIFGIYHKRIANQFKLQLQIFVYKNDMQTFNYQKCFSFKVRSVSQTHPLTDNCRVNPTIVSEVFRLFRTSYVDWYPVHI